MTEVVVEGRVVRGLGRGAYYVSLEYYSRFFEKVAGCRPYPGTVNLHSNIDWRMLAACCEPLVVPGQGGLGGVYVWRGSVEGLGGVLVIRPLMSTHPPVVLEIVACRRLGVPVGSRLRVRVECVRGLTGPRGCVSDACRADPYTWCSSVQAST